MTSISHAYGRRGRAIFLALAVLVSSLTVASAPAQAVPAVYYASVDCANPTAPQLPSTIYLAGGDTLELALQGQHACNSVLEVSASGAGGAGLFGSSAYTDLVGATPSTGKAISTASITLTALADPSGVVRLRLSNALGASFEVSIQAGGTANTVVVSGDMTPTATIAWTGRAVEVWLCRSTTQYGPCANEMSALVFSVGPSQTSLTITPGTSAVQRDGTSVTVGSSQTWTVIVNNGTSAAVSASFPTVRVMSSGGGMQSGTAANLTVSGDGTNSLTFSWTGTAIFPLVFCDANLTYLECLSMGQGQPRIRFFYSTGPQALTPPVTLSVGDTVRCFGSMNCAIPIAAGQYSVFIDNGSVGTNVLQVSFGPGGAQPQVVTEPATPTIVPLAAATFDKAAVAGSSLTCVSPEWDKTPTSVTVSASIDGTALGSTTLTAGPFRSQFAVPASAAGKTLLCEVQAAFGNGRHTISVETSIAAAQTGTSGGSNGGTTPTTPECTIKTTAVGFGNGSTTLSRVARRAASSVKNCSGTIIVTGYALPGSSRAAALSRARAEAVAALVRAANPGATVQVVAAGGTRNAACAASANRCAVVRRG